MKETKKRKNNAATFISECLLHHHAVVGHPRQIIAADAVAHRVLLLQSLRNILPARPTIPSQGVARASGNQWIGPRKTRKTIGRGGGCVPQHDVGAEKSRNWGEGSSFEIERDPFGWGIGEQGKSCIDFTLENAATAQATPPPNPPCLHKMNQAAKGLSRRLQSPSAMLKY